MTNAGNKKLLVVLLALALFACSVMALGGTLANQTEVDKTLTPVVQLGPDDKEYDVVVQYGNNYNQTLSNSNPIFSANDLWCPGYTKVVDLQITNNEAFPVEVMLNMVVGESDLNEVMYYAVLGTQPTSWSDIAENQKVNLTNNNTLTIVELTNLESKESCTCTLVVHMSEDATNEHQNKTLNVGFNLVVNANFKPHATDLTDPK